MNARSLVTRVAVLAVGAAVLFGTGCETMSNQEKGTLAGAGIGSVAGAIIGKATGNPKTGAVIGAIGGGVVGNLAGRDEDRKEERRDAVRQAQADQAYRDDQPARIAQIIELTRNGQDDTVILNHIRNNRMTFRLSVDDLNTLRANNVSPKVIAAMQSSGDPVVTRPAPRPVVVREEVIVRDPSPVVFVEPYRPPPPGLVIYGGRRW